VELAEVSSRGLVGSRVVVPGTKTIPFNRWKGVAEVMNDVLRVAMFIVRM